MSRIASWFAALALVVVPLHVAAAPVPILLDADTPSTGSNLDAAPLVTPYGTITFMGEIRGRSDPDFILAGAVGDVFDIDGSATASLSFGFDVVSITFIYGGNAGGFDVEARDIGGAVVDSFFQVSTDDGQPAGPITLSGLGIRSLFWRDPPSFNFAPIDNVLITPVPEPATAALAVVALGAAMAAPRLNRRSARSRSCA